MKKEKTKRFIQIFAIALIMLLIASSTYAYFAAQVGQGSSTDITVSTSTVDNLTFETGDAISISATQSNFGSGAGNQSDDTYASATLVANNDTNEASANYYLYIKIDTNEFEYTTSDKTAELILSITGPDGNEVSSLSGLSYTSVTDGEGNIVSGFDITTKTGLITVASEYLIESTGTNTQEWNIEVTLVNLDSDQSGNSGKKLAAKIIIMQGSDILQVVGNNSYSEKIWAYKDSITKIVFDDSGGAIDEYDYVYDISDREDKSILAYMVNNSNDTYTVYIESSSLIICSEDMSYWFYGFSSLESIEGLDKLITSNVTNMSYLFAQQYGTSSLTSLDLSSWDTSNVVNMSHLFECSTMLSTVDLSNWDTSNVTNMADMFKTCANLTSLDLSSFVTSSVTDMSGMFFNCDNLTLLDMHNADFSNVTTYDYMFYSYNLSITVTVKDSDAYDFITARLTEYEVVGTVVIA